MKTFKRLMSTYHTQNKTILHNLYTDRQVYYSSVSSFDQPIEDEKVFHHRTISFRFAGTGFRTPERMILYVWVPEDALPSEAVRRIENGAPSEPYALRTAYEDWLLRLLSPSVNELSESLQNDHKDARAKSSFAMQEPGSVVISRNGCLYVADQRALRLRISFCFPLINGCRVDGKNGYKDVHALLNLICDRLEAADPAALAEHVLTYSRQRQIRAFLKQNGLLAFVADGSILPRKGTTQAPLPGAVPFQSPPSLRVTIRTSDGCAVTGMGLKSGITVITGGGYSGKSTLLDCLEQGIYDHVKGDGREYVLSEESACKVYAEDGRYLSDTNLSPFFSWLPGTNDPHCFQTPHASGSVSQAANIVEAVYGGSHCLLIDEDTSATNFMIRDETMRRLVKKEPIVPFTDRIRELSALGVSTILVIGGSGEYLKYADRVLLLEDYLVTDATEWIVQDGQDAPKHAAAAPSHATPGSPCPLPSLPPAGTHSWMQHKHFSPAAADGGFTLGQYVRFEQTRYIRLGSFTADVTRLTALTESGQYNSLAWLLERLLLTDAESDGNSAVELRARCEAAVETLFQTSMDAVPTSRAHQCELWLEQVRSLDLLMAACRLRPDNPVT